MGLEECPQGSMNDWRSDQLAQQLEGRKGDRFTEWNNQIDGTAVDTRIYNGAAEMWEGHLRRATTEGRVPRARSPGAGCTMSHNGPSTDANKPAQCASIRPPELAGGVRCRAATMHRSTAVAGRVTDYTEWRSSSNPCRLLLACGGKYWRSALRLSGGVGLR